MENASETNSDRKRKGYLAVAVLALATLTAHLVTRESSAVPEPPPPSVAAAGPVSLSARLDRGAVLTSGDGRVRMELTLRAEERVSEPTLYVLTDVVVVLDRSGSMSGEPLETARRAVLELIDRLAPEDRLALIAYSYDAELAIPLAAARPSARELWRRQVESIEAVGGTNMSSGLDLALDVVGTNRPAGRSARILLLSDGLANQGDSSVEGLSRRARTAARAEAVVSTLGVGMSFDEFLMGQLADAGTGNFYYLADTERLAQVFAREFEASRETVARALAVTLEPAPGVRVVDAAGYPLETATDGRVTFRPGSLFAGQERRVWVTLEVVERAAGEKPLSTVGVSFDDLGETRQIALAEPLEIRCVDDRESFFASVDRETWSRSVVEDAYSQLQQEVALHVREGRRDEALSKIESYRAENRALNEELQSEVVTHNLAEIETLEAEVEDAFVGADQAQKQNVLSKDRQAKGWDGRRLGAKKKSQ